MSASGVLRLLFPQWQGGDIAHWIGEVQDPADSSRGYALGARLLNFLAPAGQETVEVPVDMAWDRRIQDGVWDRDILVRQTGAALDLLDARNPERVVTLGGECSVSVAPFTWLAKRHAGDVAMIWLDAHPDITLPGDPYAGWHAMAVTACMGLGDPKLEAILPARFDPADILFVGLRSWERDEIRRRQEEHGIRHLSPADVAADSTAIRRWLDSRKASKVVIHFDMDVLDPAEIVAAVGTDPDGMKLEEAVRVINDVAGMRDLVGLTVAEPMPRTAIRLRNMLHALPLLG